MRRSLLLLVLCLFALIAPPLSLGARAQPNACETLIADWESKYPIDDEGAAILSGCRRAIDGTWFLPTIPVDDRFVGGAILSESNTTRVMPQIDLLAAQIEAFVDAIPDDMWDLLATMYTSTKVPRYGYRDPSVMYAGLADRYAEFVQSALSVPGNDLLAQYAGWIIQRRLSAFPQTACQTMPDIICASVQSILGVFEPPWPWDLSDPVTAAEFLRWEIDHGLL